MIRNIFNIIILFLVTSNIYAESLPDAYQSHLSLLSNKCPAKWVNKKGWTDKEWYMQLDIVNKHQYYTQAGYSWSKDPDGTLLFSIIVNGLVEETLEYLYAYNLSLEQMLLELGDISFYLIALSSVVEILDLDNNDLKDDIYNISDKEYMTPISQNQLYEDLAHLLSVASKVKIGHITKLDKIGTENFLPVEIKFNHKGKSTATPLQELLVQILRRMYIFVYQESLECNSTLQTIIEMNAKKLKDRYKN